MARKKTDKSSQSTHRMLAYKNFISFITGQTDTFPREILEYTSDTEYGLIVEIVERVCLNNCYVKMVEHALQTMKQLKMQYPILNLIFLARSAYHKCRCKSDAILGKYDFFTYDLKYYRPRKRKVTMLAKGNQRSGIYKLYELGCYMLYSVYRRLNVGFSVRELNYICSQSSLDVLLDELVQILSKYPALFSSAEYRTITNALNHIVNAELNKLNSSELRAVRKYLSVFNQLSDFKTSTKQKSINNRRANKVSK